VAVGILAVAILATIVTISFAPIPEFFLMLRKSAD